MCHNASAGIFPDERSRFYISASRIGWRSLLGALTGTSPRDGRTLVFLDEIQECPRAITALKLFGGSPFVLSQLDFGSYWYDDPRARSNGEFDCVLARKGSMGFFECKRFDRPMTRAECEAEERQVRAIPGASIGSVGFVCTGGFDFESADYQLVSGDDLFAG